MRIVVFAYNPEPADSFLLVLQPHELHAEAAPEVDGDISAELNLMVLPVFVASITASLGPTLLAPTTSPFFCSHFTFMTPMPPLAWFLYSLQSTRLPNPLSVTVKSEQRFVHHVHGDKLVALAQAHADDPVSYPAHAASRLLP